MTLGEESCVVAQLVSSTVESSKAIIFWSVPNFIHKEAYVALIAVVYTASNINYDTVAY